MSAEHFETVIVGGGQAGLAAGYHLKRKGRPFVILDANDLGRQRARGRLLAHALGFAAVVHACEVRRTAGYALSRAGLVLPDEGRDGGLPRGVCRAVRSSGPHRRRRGANLARRRSVRRGRGRPALRGRQRRRRVGRAPDSEGAQLRAGARCAHRADAFERVPEPGATARGRRARRGPRQLGRRDCLRALADACGLARGEARGSDPRSPRKLRGAVRISGVPVSRPPRADEGDADRAQGRPEARRGRDAADQGEVEGPRSRRSRERRKGHRRARRNARAGGRSRPRRGEPHLVHRLRPPFLVDRPPGFRRGRRAAARARRRRVAAGLLLRRARLSIRGFLRCAAGRGEGRRRKT